MSACLLVLVPRRPCSRYGYRLRRSANINGNQNVAGASLGLDFDVDNEIIVTRLGVFDENSDGLNLAITARLWDRAQLTELASLEFTPESPGELIGGSRFKALPTPLRLAPGFQGTISTDGYAAEERIFNSHGNAAVITWTLNDGAASIRFVGTSRYGTGGEFPATADGGPAARFVAGTFEYQTTPAVVPSRPVVAIDPRQTDRVVLARRDRACASGEISHPTRHLAGWALYPIS
jgi:hypothetical protein